MKVILYISFFLSTILANANQEHYTEIYETANNTYAKGDFDVALSEYQKILQSDLISDDLHYNTANTYFKLGQFTNAILHYEKALKLNPIHEDALFNLSIAKQQTVDKIEPLPKFFTAKIMQATKYSLSSKGWAISSIVLLCLFAAFLALYFLGKSVALKKIGFILGASCFILFCVSISVGYSATNELTSSKYGIVFSPTVTVKSAPDQSGNKLFVIHEGTKVKVLEINNGWAKISIEDGNIGWVRVDDYQLI